MKKVIKSLAFVGLMFIGTAAWAIPFTTGFTLHATTSGASVCAAGCSGSVSSVEPTAGFTGGLIGVGGIDIDIDINGTIVEFGTVLNGFLTIVDNAITRIEFTGVSSTDPTGVSLTLSSNYDYTDPDNPIYLNTGYTVSGLVDGKLLVGQGSRVTVPEPSVVALFGLGLVAMGFAHRRKKIPA